MTVFSKVYVGSTAVTRIYQGADLIWQAAGVARPVADPFTVNYTPADIPAVFDFGPRFTGGTPPYTYTVISNPSANVTVSGSEATVNLSEGDEVTLQIRATDSEGVSSEADSDLYLSFVVAYEPMVTDGTAPSTLYMIPGQAIDPIDLDATISGGSGTRTWGGGVDLEPGLSVSGVGVVSGTPDATLTAPTFGTHWTFEQSGTYMTVPALDPAYTIPAGHTVHRDLQSDPAVSNVGAEHTGAWTSGFEPVVGSTWYFKLHVVDAGGAIVATSVSDPLLIETATTPEPAPEPGAPAPSITSSATFEEYVASLDTTAGRTSTAALKDPSSLPTGWSRTGSDISTTQDNPDPLEDYDLSNHRLFLDHAGWAVRQCSWEDTTGADNNQYIMIGTGGHNGTFERNTVLGFNGYGGPGIFIAWNRTGSGQGVTGARDCAIRLNYFDRIQSDCIKPRTGSLVEFNYIGRHVNYPPGTDLYDPSRTYSAGDFCLFPANSGSLGLKRARVTTQGNEPAANKTAQTTYWTGLDPHGDHITVDGMTGRCVIRGNKYLRSLDQAVGVNNILRAGRNGATSFSDARYDDVDFIGNQWNKLVSDVTNSEVIQVFDGGDPNWNGRVYIGHNIIGSGAGGNHIYPTGIPAGTLWGNNRDAVTGDDIATPAGATAEVTLAPNVGDPPPFWGDYRSNVTGSISLPDFSAQIPAGANVSADSQVLPWINSRRHLGEGFGRVKRDVTAPSGAVVEMRGEDEAGTPTMWQWVGTKADGSAETLEVRLPEHTLAMAVRARINNHASQASDVTANAISVGPVCGGEDQSNGSRQFLLSGPLNQMTATYIPPEWENLAYVTWGDHTSQTADNRVWHTMIPVNNTTSGYNGGSKKVSVSAVEAALALIHETGGKCRVHLAPLMYSGTSAEDMLKDDTGDVRHWLPPYGDTVGIRTVEQNGCTYDFMGMIHFPPQRGAWEDNTDHWFIGIATGRHRDTGAPLVRNGSGMYEITGRAFSPRTIKHLMSDEISGLAALQTKVVWSGRGRLASRLPLKALTTDPIWADHTGYEGQLSGAVSDGGGHFAGDNKDGTPRFAAMYWSYLARAAGVTSIIVPRFDHVRWTSSYIELWSDAGPITCLREYRTGSAPYVTGLEINKTAVQGQLVGGRVRINGSYGPGDLLTYGEEGWGTWGTISSGAEYDLVCGIEGSRLGCWLNVMPMDGLVPQSIMAHPGGDR